MVKSNIKIASNIYITPNTRIEQNKEFVQNISGYNALIKFKNLYSGRLPSNIKLTDVQEKEAGNPPTCNKANNKEHTHGKIKENGTYKYVGRCEYKQCSRYGVCGEELVVERREHTLITTDDKDFFNLSALDIDYTINFENVLAKSLEQAKHTDLQSEINENIEEVSPTFVNQEKFIKISEPNSIINSRINSRILVNAGPGTGKTYCAINRLIYILENELASPEKILMLCYSKSAVNVIRDRIQKSIRDGVLSITANDICVATFDSLAGGYAYHILDEKPKSYNETISLYNANINSEFLNKESIEYLIIDELQDIVNERAKMVLNILKHIECGYLLLGDKCQAIYDFEDRSDAVLLSEQFYERLEHSLHSDTVYYELIGNKRQNTKLANISDEVREILLHINKDEQCDWVKDTIAQKDIHEIKLKNLVDNAKTIQKNSAILCRNNGEVLMVSGELSKNNIPHTVRTGDNNAEKVSRLIADVLWDYADTKILYSEFKERYISRIKDDENEAFSLYKPLTKLIGLDEYAPLDLIPLKNELMNNKQLPTELLEVQHDLVVSTIHRSKGQEFEHVYILENIAEEYATTSFEARVKYVAFTRPKNSIEQISRNRDWRFRREKVSNRIFRLNKKGACYWCSGIGIVSEKQLDKFSFANILTPENNIAIQSYISNNIKQYDMVVAKLNTDNEYDIYHQENLIGKLAKESFDEFWLVINSTNNKRAVPHSLENLYVSNIYTVVSNKSVSNLSIQHTHSGFWLGIEITGMGTAKYQGYN